MDDGRYIEEMTRVLKPGGKLIVATWCQRDSGPENPFTPKVICISMGTITHRVYIISICDSVHTCIHIMNFRYF